MTRASALVLRNTLADPKNEGETTVAPLTQKLDHCASIMHGSCMATKTITLELDAYEKLRSAKRGRESFSAVVRRVVIPGHSKSGSEVLAYLRAEGPFFSETELDAMESATDEDRPPADPWTEEEIASAAGES